MKIVLRYVSIVYLIALIISANILFANDLDSIKNYRFGGYVGFNYLNHTTNIPIIWGADYCGQFESGTNYSYQLGIDFSYNIYKSILWADLRLSYSNIPAYFERISSDFKVFNPQKMNYEPLYLKQEFNASTGYLFLEPGIILHPLSEIPIKARIALGAGNPIISNSYETTEEIVSPKTYTYEDQSQKMTTQSGKLTNATTSLNGIISVIFEKELKNDFFVNAEVFYSHPINSNLNDYDWKMNKIGMNIGLSYAFDLKEEPKPERKIIDTIKKEEVIEKVEEPRIVKTTLEIESKPINLRETIVTQTYPILPYIFFDSTSSALRDKYQLKDIENFDESKIQKESLEIYYSLLNIIGSRLSKNTSKIEIVGMTDGAELSTKDERLKLAQKRAESTAYYLMTKWGIDKSRIKISSRDIPQLATSNLYAEGFEENRRVEIFSDDNEIMKPLIHSKFKEYEVMMQIFSFSINSDDLNQFSNFKIQIIHKNNVTSEMSFNKIEDISTFKIDENLKNVIKNAAKSDEEIFIKVQAYDTDNNLIESISKFEYNKELNNFELGRLNLIVFDFDKSEISDLNKNIIKNFVSNSIFDNSEIRIIGSTDRLGEKDYNLKLSQQRADETYKYLKTIKPNANYKEVKGIGNSILPYDNNLPEGRFYCRTVLIEVTTPIK